MSDMNLEKWHSLTPEQKAEVSAAKRARMAEAWKMRLSGKSVIHIAQHFDVTPTQIAIDLRNFAKDMRKLEYEDAEQLRQIEAERLKRLLETFTIRAEAGDMDAAKLIIVLSQSLRKLLGVDMPTKFEHKVENKTRPNSTLTQEELDQKMEALYFRLLKRSQPIHPSFQKWAIQRGIDQKIVEGKVIERKVVDVDSEEPKAS